MSALIRLVGGKHLSTEDMDRIMRMIPQESLQVLKASACPDIRWRYLLGQIFLLLSICAMVAFNKAFITRTHLHVWFKSSMYNAKTRLRSLFTDKVSEEPLEPRASDILFIIPTAPNMLWSRFSSPYMFRVYIFSPPRSASPHPESPSDVIRWNANGKFTWDSILEKVIRHKHLQQRFLLFAMQNLKIDTRTAQDKACVLEEQRDVSFANSTSSPAICQDYTSLTEGHEEHQPPTESIRRSEETCVIDPIMKPNGISSEPPSAERDVSFVNSTSSPQVLHEELQPPESIRRSEETCAIDPIMKPTGISSMNESVGYSHSEGSSVSQDERGDVSIDATGRTKKGNRLCQKARGTRKFPSLSNLLAPKKRQGAP